MKGKRDEAAYTKAKKQLRRFKKATSAESVGEFWLR